MDPHLQELLEKISRQLEQLVETNKDMEFILEQIRQGTL